MIQLLCKNFKYLGYDEDLGRREEDLAPLGAEPAPRALSAGMVAGLSTQGKTKEISLNNILGKSIEETLQSIKKNEPGDVNRSISFPILLSSLPFMTSHGSFFSDTL